MTATATPDLQVIEMAIMMGDLSPLNPQQRLQHYKNVCETLGLNFSTHPLDFYTDQEGKTRLEVNKDGAAQLRKLHNISVVALYHSIIESVVVYSAEGQDKDGRKDFGTGAVSLANLGGVDKANAFMAAETKAKRRMTISLAGSGMLSEDEVATIKGAGAPPLPAQVAPQAAPEPVVAPTVAAAPPVEEEKPTAAQEQATPAVGPAPKAQAAAPAQTTASAAKGTLFQAKPAAPAAAPQQPESKPAEEPAQNAVAAAAPAAAEAPVATAKEVITGMPSPKENQAFMARASVIAREALGKIGMKDGGQQVKIYLLRQAGKTKLPELSLQDWETGLAALEAKVPEGGEAVAKLVKGE